MEIRRYDLSEEIVLEVGKFAILWNWFECNFCDNDCNSTKIEDISKRIHIAEKVQKNFADELKNRCFSFGLSEMDYVKESLHPEKARRSSEKDMEIMNNFIKQSGSESTHGCLLVLYRMRNNLMHGLKCLDELDKQLELFRAATAVLDGIVDNPIGSRGL
ncbi:MAG: hypothetical protein IJZ19_02985 [Lentisphaeria bacterium]|nr:hypothetical protein [Lentisphaeria bacterium]